MKVKRGLSGSTLKIIAIITMLIDHIGAALLTRILISRGFLGRAGVGQTKDILDGFLNNETMYGLLGIMRMIGRMGFPLFCFLLVEGFQKTGNRKKYVLRLAGFAFLSEIPYDLAFSGKVIDPSSQNVYFTLLLGMLFMCVCQYLPELKLPEIGRWLAVGTGIVLLPAYYLNRYPTFLCKVAEPVLDLGVKIGLIRSNMGAFVFLSICLSAILLLLWFLYRKMAGREEAWVIGAGLALLTLGMYLGDLLRTDYSASGVLTIAIMYFLRNSHFLSGLGGCTMLNITHTNEITAYLALIPIAYYNGERGLKLKYLFYVFYPAHLLIIWSIAEIMGLGSISVN